MFSMDAKVSDGASEVPTQLSGDDDEDAIDIMAEPLMFTADAYIESEVKKLSAKEREKFYFDIHGLTNEVEESPQFVKCKMLELEQQLNEKMMKKDSESSTSMHAYELAKSIDPNFVTDHDFRLKFLRSCRFNTEKAATRMANHFDVKLNLFGRDKLVQNIVQDDLGEEDTIGSLYDGYKQVLPLRDRKGRLVFCDMAKLLKCDDNWTMQEKLKRMFYTTMVAVEDEETQKKGTICVMYAVDIKAMKFDPKYFKQITKVFEAIPIRMEAFHVCYNSRRWLPLIAMFKLCSRLQCTLRAQFHFGGHKKCLFKLQTMGIPVSVMPLTKDGKVLKDQNTEIWKQRREYERSMMMLTKSLKHHHINKEATTYHPTIESETKIFPSKKVTACTKVCFSPGPFDVVLGRGKGYHSHVGNIRLRKMVQDLKSTYDDSPKSDKYQITQQIVKQIKQEMSGNFLKRGKEGIGWVQVDDEEARLKVSHTFRNLKAEDEKITSITPAKKNKKLLEEDDKACCKGGELISTTKNKRVRGDAFGRRFFTID